MASIEKAIAAALEPLLDDLIALQARVDAFKTEPGPQGEPGRDADPDEVAERLKHDGEFIAQLHEQTVTSETLEIDPDDLARTLEKNLGLCELLRGQPGAGIDTKIHESGSVYREGSIVTAHIGQFFKAARDTVAAPGESEDWARIGSAGFRWRKLKPDEKTLSEGDLYIDGGSLFLFSGGRASMLVQRGKAGHSIRQIAIEETDLVCSMDSGAQFRADLSPLFKSVSQNISDQIKHASDALADISTRLSILENRLQLLDDLAGGEM